MTTNIETISAYIKKRLDSFSVAPSVYEVGTVTACADGVIRVKGLPGRRYDELLQFDCGAYGLAFQLEEDFISVVMLSDADRVTVGSAVYGTGRVIEVPIGDVLTGRIVDPLGRPLDGRPLEANAFRPAERPAPSIIDRQKVNRSLPTGILSIDSMTPIGKGQRELIIGDRQTGKTTIAIDTILNQAGNNVHCFYCAIAQKASTIASIIEELTAAGAMEYTTVVATTSADSPTLQYLAPYAACAMAEGFMYAGEDALVVYDDLSKHAVAYRTMSLLLHRPAGREAYPGDVFYLHSRLLERAAQLSPELGGGSMTALPIIETLNGDISAYIPTNVISITDGQIFLDTDLFNNGMRPAINVGLSVSRVGRNAQRPAMRQVSGGLRIELSQYRELVSFTPFGTDIDPATHKMLTSGAALTEILKQKKHVPYSLSTLVSLLLAHKEGVYISVPIQEISAFNHGLCAYLAAQCMNTLNHIDVTGEMTDTEQQILVEAIKAYAESKRN
ncbi:MAG: F0F1 ATP synthase subunit alpha [Clostridia bacterium]|nr:F0F1 ATP synthase subunit alpha [Clostridia bacterium]